MIAARFWKYFCSTFLVAVYWDVLSPVGSHIITIPARDPQPGQQYEVVSDLESDGGKKKQPKFTPPTRRLYLEMILQISDSGEMKTILFDCVQQDGPVTVHCSEVDSYAEIQNIYYSTNFYVGTNLKVLSGWSFVIPGLRSLPSRMMIGVRHADQLKRVFLSMCQGKNMFKDDALQLIPDFIDETAVGSLLDFFCINDLIIFDTNYQGSANSFSTYAQTLKRVVTNYEQSEQTTIQRSGILSSLKSFWGVGSRTFQQVKSTSRKWSLPKSLSSLSKKMSKNNSMPSTTIMSRSGSRSPPQPNPGVSEENLRFAVGLLLQKMIDPCIVLAPRDTAWHVDGIDPTQILDPDLICTTYCKFLTVPAKLAKQLEKSILLETCKNAASGKCVDRVCTCKASYYSGLRLQQRSIPMHSCNTFFRTNTF